MGSLELGDLRIVYGFIGAEGPQNSVEAHGTEGTSELWGFIGLEGPQNSVGPHWRYRMIIWDLIGLRDLRIV